MCGHDEREKIPTKPKKLCHKPQRSTGRHARGNEINLVWIDMEMTGLDPDTDRIIEVAAVVTDANLNILAEGPVFAIHQPDDVLDGMDAWNKGTHGRSGLIDRVKASTITEADCRSCAGRFPAALRPARQVADVRQHDLPGPPLHGARLQKLEAFFHYRNLDVSTLKELAAAGNPRLIAFKKNRSTPRWPISSNRSRNCALPRPLVRSMSVRRVSGSGLAFCLTRQEARPDPNAVIAS